MKIIRVVAYVVTLTFLYEMYKASKRPSYPLGDTTVHAVDVEEEITIPRDITVVVAQSQNHARRSQA